MNVAVQSPSRVKRVVKSKWSWGSVIVVVVLSWLVISRVSTAIDSIQYGLTPPLLPPYQDADVVNLNPLGWPNEGAEWFHHASQGTATIPIPYEWFTALEAPKSNPWFIFLGAEQLLKDEYMLQLGFIKQQVTPLNPDALPIGIAKTESIYFEGLQRQAVAVGFSCAACHTGQMLYDGKRYVVDGGPAMIDLGLLTRSLGAALGQTALSSKVSLMGGRFDRFAKKVLGSSDNILTRNNLKKELGATVEGLVKTVDTINVTEGFTRLDALNRIGNQVFSTDMQRLTNYSPINAPVNYPHIWTTSWFDWVQYDASIMQPLIRNSGEALGVEAYVDTAGPDAQRFASSVDINSLINIERWIAGTHPRAQKQFNGLRAPRWPSDFPSVDTELAGKGNGLYQELCQGCHLPTIKNQEFWSDKYWKKIQYVDGGKLKQTEEEYLRLNIIALSKINTDSAQANVLATRTVDTTGLNLQAEVCTPISTESGTIVLKPTSTKPSSNPLTMVVLNDSATSNFGLALGAFVGRTNKRWFDQNYIPQSARSHFEGGRPNCLQAGAGYKARPLNGVWATAPFLHNGSIATIYDLLSPMNQRPKFVQLGGQGFDAEHLGIIQGEEIKALEKKKHSSYKTTPDYVNGLFVLDTREAGNHNTGHVFDDQNVEGKIGRGLSEEEKLALIEYIKTL